MAPEGRTTLLALLDDVDAGRAHAFCARPVRHTAGILMSAWDAFGPPPPPESNGGEGAEIWNRVERAAFERGCASCAAAYERCLDHWDEAVAEAGLGTARVWRLYMAASRLGFDLDTIQLHQTLGVKLGPGGSSGMPLRPDFTRAASLAGAGI